METLQEFVRFTKFWEYGIAVLFIVPGIVFWTLWRGSQKRGDEERGGPKATPDGHGAHHQ